MNEENYVYDQPALSRSEADLGATIADQGPIYDQPPLSRIEFLLQNLIAGGGSFIKIKGTVEDVDDLPATGNEDGDLYFVGPDSSGNFDEYVYSEYKEDFEKLGSTEIDTSQFVRKSGDVMTGTLNNKARVGFKYGYHTSSGIYAVEFDTIGNGYGCELKLRNLPEGPNADRQTIAKVTDALSIRLRENATTPGVYNAKEVFLNNILTEWSDDAIVPKTYVDAKAASAVSENFEASLLSYIDDHIITQSEYDQLQDKTGFWFIKETTA